MQINRIENQGTFGAKLRLIGYTEGISQEYKKYWAESAKNVGTENDIITLSFKKPKDETTYTVRKNKSAYGLEELITSIYGKDAAKIHKSTIDAADKYLYIHETNTPIKASAILNGKPTKVKNLLLIST